MSVQISIAKGTSNPTSSTGLTLAEPVFNYSNNTFWIGKGSGNSPVWVGAGVCGASAGIAAGLTYQIPTLGAVKDYFSAVSSGFLGATVSYVATFNGATGAVTGVSSFNGLTGAVTGASLGANTFTGLQTLNAGLTSSFAYVSGGLTVGGNLYVNGNLTVSGGVTTSISEIVLIEDNIITLNSNVTGSPTENAGVEIERGTSANTQILWNETSDKWTFTNDGSVYYNIPTDYVGSFNGRTGAVQGVSAAVAGTGIAVSGATGSVTITNTGVQSFNGLTGAVTGVTVGGANIFTALNSFNSGISSAGGTFSVVTRFTAGISSAGGTFSANTVFSSGLQTDSVLSTTGIGGTLYLNSSASGDGGNSITYIGDWDYTNNGTAITVDDQSGLITLSPSISTSTITSSNSVTIGAAAAFIDTTIAVLGTTAANQTIASVTVFDNDALLDTNRSVEFFVQASHSSGYEALKIIATHDGTNAYNTQYGLIRSGSSLCSSYTTTIVTAGSGNKVLRLRATPTNTNTTFKVVETVIPA